MTESERRSEAYYRRNADRPRCFVCRRNYAEVDGGTCHRCAGRESAANVERPLAPQVTDAQPGTEDKIRVMEGRVASGYRPCHPGDYQETG